MNPIGIIAPKIMKKRFFVLIKTKTSVDVTPSPTRKTAKKIKIAILSSKKTLHILKILFNINLLILFI
jgi:hypothetical protein